MKNFGYFAGVAVLLLAGSDSRAANVSFSGTFTSDTDLQYFTFTVGPGATDVALRTWSYAGGTDVNGQMVPRGGFEPILNLYMADGTGMNPGTSGPCPSGAMGIANVQPDAVTGSCYDVYYPTTLSFPGGTWTPGTYLVVLSVAGNNGVGDLSDGFQAEASYGLTPPSNFTCQVGGFGFQGAPVVPETNPFCDSSGAERNGTWELDFVGVTSAVENQTVPEPGSLSLGLLGAAALAARRLRRSR